MPGGEALKIYNSGDANRLIQFNKWRIIKNAGYQAHVSDWWTQNDTFAVCIAKVTGCKQLYDNSCAERYALQSLIKGPFQKALTESEEQRIKGVPPAIMHSLLTLPRSYSSRLDVGVHLRCQFHFFEKGHDITSPQYMAEVVSYIVYSVCSSSSSSSSSSV